MKKLLRFAILLAAACLVCGALYYLIGVSSASAIAFSPQSAILVTTLDDELNTDGDCSLREAVEAANTNAIVDGCASGQAITDTITFASPGTITLDSQLLVTGGGSLVIDGAGSITFLGGGTDRLIWVYDDALLSLENLKLTGGHFQGDGGGIFNAGVLYVIDSILSNNIATGPGGGGGIYNRGALFIFGSILDGNQATEVGARGGGILNFEYGVQAVISDTILSNNSAMNGGGIINGIPLKIINSSLYGNTALRGGGIYNYASLAIDGTTFFGNQAEIEGGAINNYNVITMTNSTMTGNSAVGDHGDGGAIYNQSVNEAMVHVLYSTISENSSVWSGGGIKNYLFPEHFILASSIVNDNFPANCSGIVTDGNNNIEDSDTCGLNADNSSMVNTDPRIKPLQDNGGPTWTHALYWDSPAIDAGDGTQCPPTDQRSLPRPMDGNGDGISLCDIGAYELQEPPQLVFFPAIVSAP